MLGNSYWNRNYRQVGEIKFNNRIKWFHYQMVRGILKVNHIVSKFKNGVNENCTFCNGASETIIHLFFECQISRKFIKEALAYLVRFGITYDFNDARPYEFVMQSRAERWHYKSFVLLLYVKYFIWKSRCGKKVPTMREFKLWLKKELNLIFECGDAFKTLHFTRNIRDALNEEFDNP